MYSKEELSAKDMAELQDIAHEMGIEPSTEGNAEELVYAILDRQAEIEGNKNPLGTKRRRTRITKKDTDRVYTVNGKDGENFDVKKNKADENEPIHFPDLLRPEARPMLEQLRAMGLQLALASSSPMSNIRQVLGECGLMEFFPVIVSGEQFEASKPDPEIYLHTMARLGRRPEECLIVEDSTYGVQAGAAAGGLVAALRDERFPFDQSAARFHIGNLSEIPALAASIQ